ncbi:mechanosensitive ion channel family protein [Abyssalbus ytuae]|uniref:Mechanosensitive ion channel family protein n=1 Tax=Abyssalbus ytuae TaxID=2926907 RepID=A0A9E6ZZ66_9FLAO|nr:mechanosensitive ion channel domain-containing protein [Abyssalbus ytuae]UOB16551.1 mechanosensitive ion channel family protein [Abyssalbus ytuae]
MKNLKKFITPLIILLIAVFLKDGLSYFIDVTDENIRYILKKVSSILLIISITWSLIAFLKTVKKHYLERFDMTSHNNLRARKLYTQLNILERIIIFIIIVVSAAIILMLFDEVRKIGVSIFASAGIAGIIIGFAAQKAIGTILAGFQIAISQPIRLDDVLVVEGEWGRVEEITLTYVVVRIWDQRRLILPTTYFIDKPFQNWTRTTSEILGTVYLYTDYNIDFDALREELTKLLKSNDLWDERVNNIQVTDSKEDYVEIRALMSARNSSDAWDLRVYVREHLIKFIQKNYPDSFSKTRVVFNNHPKNSENNDE